MRSAVSAPQVPADLVELGRIVSAYGIRGWVKIQPHSAQAEVLLSARQWWLARPAPVAVRAGTPAAGVPLQASPVAVLAARAHGSSVVAQLEGVDDRNQAEAMQGRHVYVPRSLFPAPEEGEYYWVDLVGCLLYGEQDGESVLLGRVSEVTDNGVHAILKVARLAPADPASGGEAAPVLDAKGRPAELLVPFVGAHVREVDLAGRRIDTDWPADF